MLYILISIHFDCTFALISAFVSLNYHGRSSSRSSRIWSRYNM